MAYFLGCEKQMEGRPFVVVANMTNYDIVGNEFELGLRYYVHFWTNTLGKSIDLLIPPAIGQILALLFVSNATFGIK